MIVSEKNIMLFFRVLAPELREIETRIEMLEDDYESVGGIDYSAPRVKSSFGISSTEAIGSRAADESTAEKIRELRLRAASMRLAAAALLRIFAELPEPDGGIIRARLADGVKWDIIAEDYSRSKRSCQYIYAARIREVVERAGRSGVISAAFARVRYN